MLKPDRRIALDGMREKWGASKCMIRKRRAIPPDRWADEQEFEKCFRRMGHLARHLALLQKQYHADRGLYCEYLLACLINVMIRNWPDIEFGKELKSVGAAAAEGVQLVGEHDVPISFFRDLLMGQEILDADDWQYLLATCLRLKRIAPEEDARLRKMKWKQNRPVHAYRDAGIHLTDSSRKLESAFRRFLDRKFAV
nr:hypothetical protein [uncultured bacterium]